MSGLPLCTAAKRVWAIAAVLAAYVTFVEVLCAYHSDDWVTEGSVQWLGVALGFGVYFLILGVIAHLFYLFVRLVGRLLPILKERDFVIPCCATMVALAAFPVAAKFANVRVAALLGAACGVAVCGCAVYVATRFRHISMPAVCAIMINTCLAGILGLASASYAFLLRDDRYLLACGFAGVLMLSTVAAGLVARFSRLGSSRRFLITQAAVILCALAPGLAVWCQGRWPRRPSPNAAPSLILIVPDALRADYCSVYGGGAPTPAFEELAQHGVLFEKCYALAPWTVPSMFGMFASEYPPGPSPDTSSLEMARMAARYTFNAEATLAELLLGQGYATGAFVGNAMLNNKEGILRGFQYVRSGEAQWAKRKFRKGIFGRMPFFCEALRRGRPSLVDPPRADLSSLLTHYGREFLRRHRDSSFFLWIHYMDPHDPYDPPEEYRPGSTLQQSNSWNVISGERRRISSATDFMDLDPLTRRAAGLYSGEIRYVDACVARILNELKTLGCLPNTYVCLTSDHGEEFWDHGSSGHGQSLYQELERVPLIVVGPGILPQRIATPVSGIDLMPTLAGCIGASPAEQWRGRDLAPLLRGEASASPATPCFAHGCLGGKFGPVEMVVEGDHKLIRRNSAREGELYNVAQDPREKNDLSEIHPELATRLHSRLDQWLASFPSTFDALPAAGASAEERQKNLERLRAMGYLD